MPTYDYKCTQCGHMFEEFEPISAAPLVRCPQCGQDGLKRVLGGGAGMIFKGQGFYLTDYRKGSGGPGPKKSTGGSTEGKTGSDAGKESGTAKPAADSKS